MYQPGFNSVLVEIDTEDDKWGRGNDDSMLGKSYSKGTLKDFAVVIPTNDYPEAIGVPEEWVGKQIMWNEGTEAGTLFEEDGKLYGFIYWWDIRACKK